MRRLLLVALLLVGCRFGLKGVAAGVGSSVDGGADAAADADAGGGRSGEIDMLPPFVPAHVDPGAYVPDAADLPPGITAIDTSALTINGQAPPAGVRFAPDPGHADWAVLSIGGWTVDHDVRVTGTRALVIVAARRVDVGAVIDASADHGTPGPGASGVTPGTGGNGTSSGDYDAGGGGAGFGGPGAQGGDSSGPAGPPGGTVYGALMSFFGGGTAGGTGGGGPACDGGDATKGQPGAGGGAVQLSSAIEVQIEPMGGIDVGGGGGAGGCGSLASAGGGGGSGGMVFLEAPFVMVTGQLGANGGGGGGAGSGNGNNDGHPGDDGTLGMAQANGGDAGAGNIFGSNGGNGGKGATAAAGATRGQKDDNGGGSGGGVGRIWLRAHTAPVIDPAAVISPSPMIDASL